jgi:hypothetical protein
MDKPRLPYHLPTPQSGCARIPAAFVRSSWPIAHAPVLPERVRIQIDLTAQMRPQRQPTRQGQYKGDKGGKNGQGFGGNVHF